MIHLDRRTALKAMMMLGATGASAAQPGEWTDPVEVRHEETLCLTYRARWDGLLLVVQATIEPGWHTFAMDNKLRAEEKLAGRKSLGIDHPTEFKLTGATVVEGPWYQTPPKDFSKPELRWFSWGFERQALFAAKIRRPGAGAQIAVRGQACTDAICKNIDVTIPFPSAKTRAGDSSELDVNKLTKVR
jgi:DsbC/DsbD-like thiol-disulfide interchange protein